MSNDLLFAALAAWIVAALLALSGRGLGIARALLGLGCIALLILAIATLPGATAPISTPFGIGPSTFYLSADALWLMGFGLPGAFFAAFLATPSSNQRAWTFGVAVSLVGALGVFGLQDAVSFSVAWAVMGFGGAIMILGENLASETGRPVLFMLGLLEAGFVALILALVLLAGAAGSLSFADFVAGAGQISHAEQLWIELLLLMGFGAKLGLLPFYEWFPGAYGAGSGATGALLSGIILNAAFFGLSRGLTDWMPATRVLPVSISGIFIVTIAVLSAILTSLYAFQQEGWRELLSLSSAENASISVALLGACLMFRHDGLMDLAGLAWTVALIHLAGHALAKGTMFLTADGVYRAAGDYRLVQRGVLSRSSWIFGVGALFASMSLAAMPPQAGFVSEWYLFQTFFQGFHLASLGSRLAAALAGAGLALTAAVAFATAVKAFGIGLLGRDGKKTAVPMATSVAVAVLGFLVLALAVGMPAWLLALRTVVVDNFGVDAATKMHDGWLLVPLTAKFAVISPSKLVIALPLLALLPLLLLWLAVRRYGSIRIVPVWYGGGSQAPRRAATTALTFSNALRTFYSFIYRPTAETERHPAHETEDLPYFTKRLVFTHDVAPVFGPYLFAPLERIVIAIAAKLRIIQSGHLPFYLSLIGALLVIILVVALF